MKTRAPQSPARRFGFTLIELMISIAIVLILMLGINFVFSVSAKTVSTGMALSSVGREMRNARKVFENDFNNSVAAEEMPALLIHSESIYAWRDKRDKLADYDVPKNPATYDVDGNPGDEVDLLNATNNGAPAPELAYLYNFRRHRIDRFSFFVRNGNSDYARQTGDSTTYVAADTSPEAWISYGLLRLADNVSPYPSPNPNYGRYWKPGARGNPASGVYPDETENQNNFFASQWILGRKLMLLKDETGLRVNSTFIPATVGVNPLAFGSAADKVQQLVPMFQSNPFPRENPPYVNTSPWQIQESRVDVVGATIAELRTLYTGTPPGWTDADPTTAAPATNCDFRAYNFAPATPATNNYLNWTKPFIDKSQNANPTPATAIAWQTREAALTTPVFVPGCSQFIVEFAGDFYDQGPVAGVAEKVGTIDYELLAGGARRIRWYGMPRDLDDDATLDVKPLAGTGALAWAAPGTPRWAGGATAIEKQNTLGAPFIWFWGPTIGNKPIEGSPGTPGDPSQVRPSLIRIAIEITDANGRLEDGQRIEFVFPLK